MICKKCGEIVAKPTFTEASTGVCDGCRETPQADS